MPCADYYLVGISHDILHALQAVPSNSAPKISRHYIVEDFL
jgi:hypothetical protein